MFTNSILTLEGFLCAERHCLNLQDNKSSHHELRTWRVLEEGEETRLKGDDKVKAEESVCQGGGLRRKQVTGPSHAPAQPLSPRTGHLGPMSAMSLCTSSQ